MELSPIWQNNIQRMNTIFGLCKSNKSRLMLIQNDDMFCQNGSDSVGQLKSSEIWDVILDRDFGPDWRNRIPEETSLYNDHWCWNHSGRRVSHDYYKKANQALMCLSYKPETVLELGPGFGQVGRLLLLAGERPKQYVAIDLKESLQFSKAFLDETLPGLAVLVAETSADFSRPCDALLIPADLAQEFADMMPSVDVFLNSSSLGEMPSSVAKFYIGLLQDKIRPSHAIFLNRFLNTFDPATEKYRQDETAWYWSLDGHWKINRWELEPDFTTIPYVEVAAQRELLLLADYTSEPEPVSSIPDYIFHQKWYAEFNPSPPVRRYMNLLGYDQSALSIMCEAVRRDRSVKNLKALMRYLDCIRKPFPFEDFVFLANEYSRLAGYAAGN